MKKFIILGICGILLAVLLGCNYTQFNKEEHDDVIIDNLQFQDDGVIHYRLLEGGEMNFQFIGSYQVDISDIRKFFNVEESAPFTFFLQERNLERLQEIASIFDLKLPDFGIDFDNYSDYYLAVTIGRKLVDLKLIDQWHGNLFAEFVFAEEYQDNTMHLYITDDIILYPAFIGTHAFYIMRGDEKVYYGDLLRHIMSVP